MAATRKAAFPACGPAARKADALPVYEGGGSSAPPVLPSGVYVGANQSNSDATTYTFSGQAIGDAAAGKLVLVGIHGQGFTPPTVSGVTFDGAASLAVANIGLGNPSASYAYAVVTGATSDIAVTFSGSTFRCYIEVYAIYDLASTTPTDTASATASGTAISLDLDVEADGVAIAIVSALNGASFTFTGVTENSDRQGEASNERYGAASADGLTAATPLEIDVTSPSASALVGLAVSFR